MTQTQRANLNPIFLAAAIGAITLSGGNLAHAQEDTDTLPQGYYRARVVGIFVNEIKDKFNSDGKLEGLASAFNRSISINDFIASSPALGQLVSTLNTLKSGLGDQLGGSNLYAESRLQLKSYMPALEYGLTPRVTIGARMPIIKRSSFNSFRADGVNNASEIAKQLGGISNSSLSAGLGQFGTNAFDTAFFTNSIFTAKGYETPHDFENTHVGDLESGLKYNFFRNTDASTAVNLGVRVPTGTTSSLTNIFDRGTGSGSWANMGVLSQDVYLLPWLTVGGMIKGIYSYPDTRKRAAPLNAADTLPSVKESSGQVQDVRRHTAFEFQNELSVTTQFFENRWSVWTAFQQASKGKDQFSGPGSFDYDVLSKNTNFSRKNLEIGTSISSVPWFRKKEFPIPGKINLFYNTTLSGVNTSLVTFYRVDLILYF